jgi:hypothetical protein
MLRFQYVVTTLTPAKTIERSSHRHTYSSGRQAFAAQKARTTECSVRRFDGEVASSRGGEGIFIPMAR